MTTRKLTDSQVQVLSQLVNTARDVVAFQPDPHQRRAKANFWASREQVAMEVAPEPDLSSAAAFRASRGSVPPDAANEDMRLLASALRFGGDRRISQWWSLPGFQDWFLNKDEFRQRLEYLSNVALDQLESILSSGRSSDSDKLNAIKLIMAVQKPTAPDPDTTADAVIGKMTRQQLTEYISRNIKLLPAPAVEIEATVLPAPTSP